MLVSCLFLSFLAGHIFFEKYEEDILGQESGERVSDIEPFCGRYSLKNPTIIWRAGYSAYLVSGAQPSYRISTYKQVSCTYKQKDKAKLFFPTHDQDFIHRIDKTLSGAKYN